MRNMADGGEDIPMDTFPHGSNAGDYKDTDGLLPPEVEEKDKGSGARRKRGKFYSSPYDVSGHTKKTSTSTSFMTGTTSGEIILEKRIRDKEDLYNEIHNVFPEINKKLLPLIRRGEYNRLIFNQGKSNSRDWVIAYDGRPSRDVGSAKFPKGTRKLLGKTNEQINQENYEKQKVKEEELEKSNQERERIREELPKNDDEMIDAIGRQDNLREVIKEHEDAKKQALTPEDEESHKKTIETAKISYRQVSQEVEGLRVERNRLEQVERNADEMVQVNERQVETARERVNQRLLSLRDRVKEIFKKHGFTVVAVVSAIGVVIGVIVSNLKAGLTKVANGVGNGLKELGAKLGQILPGMIGAIASFIFKTAGEVIGFLAKNAWLLVVGLVVLAVEQFKKKG